MLVFYLAYQLYRNTALLKSRLRKFMQVYFPPHWKVHLFIIEKTHSTKSQGKLFSIVYIKHKIRVLIPAGWAGAGAGVSLSSSSTSLRKRNAGVNYWTKLSTTTVLHVCQQRNNSISVFKEVKYEFSFEIHQLLKPAKFHSICELKCMVNVTFLLSTCTCCNKVYLFL